MGLLACFVFPIIRELIFKLLLAYAEITFSSFPIHKKNLFDVTVQRPYKLSEQRPALNIHDLEVLIYELPSPEF